jgi:hypothetical protein
MSEVDQPYAIPMDPDDAFDAVSNSRRRRVILSVARAADAITASDLAVEIAAIENRVQPSRVTSDQRTRVYVALTQRHLDTLHELGVLEYDPRSKEARSNDVTSALAEAVRRVETACYTPEESDQA